MPLAFCPRNLDDVNFQSWPTKISVALYEYVKFFCQKLVIQLDEKQMCTHHKQLYYCNAFETVESWLQSALPFEKGRKHNSNKLWNMLHKLVQKMSTRRCLYTRGLKLRHAGYIWPASAATPPSRPHPPSTVPLALPLTFWTKWWNESVIF